jgi:aminoglycoside 6'-N-acetyltransferase
VITYVLGAPGSGKSAVAGPLASLMPDHVVLDWDAFMTPAAALAGGDVTQDPDAWPAYRQLIRAALETMAHLPVVVLGVCTPDELEGWPIDKWLLLDCTDEERRRRLHRQARPDRLAEGIDDAAEYRSLGLPAIDTTGHTAEEVAADLARFVQRLEHDDPDVMAADRAGKAGGSSRPTLHGPRVTVRPGGLDDIEPLRAFLAEESVSRWWGQPQPAGQLAAKLRGDDSSVLLVVELDGQVAGGIQYHEEQDPMYRHVGIDIFLGGRYQGQGAGAEAIGLLARFLFDQRGHHRISIDPAAANQQAICCYHKVGFRLVGVLRQYERGADGRFHDGLLMDLVRDDLSLCPAPAADRE